jgi:hypothetical protein
MTGRATARDRTPVRATAKGSNASTGDRKGSHDRTGDRKGIERQDGRPQRYRTPGRATAKGSNASTGDRKGIERQYGRPQGIAPTVIVLEGPRSLRERQIAQRHPLQTPITLLCATLCYLCAPLWAPSNRAAIFPSPQIAQRSPFPLKSRSDLPFPSNRAAITLKITQRPSIH